MAKLNKLSGLRPSQALTLKKAGITTVEKLLIEGANATGRKYIAKKTRITPKTIERWVRHSDFFRIKGIAGLKTELLEACGISYMRQLADQNPEKLHIVMREINGKKNLVQRVPGIVQIRRWVNLAKKIR